MSERLTQAELATNAETWKHIDMVMRLLAGMQIELMKRQFTHDRSKLAPPEVAAFTEYTPKLAASTYGSEEYKQFLEGMKPALDHHYAHNRHHPEFFYNRPENQEPLRLMQWVQSLYNSLEQIALTGDENDLQKLKALRELTTGISKQSAASVNNMNLIDLLEMVIDWYAATRRHNDGNIYKSIEINIERFSLSPQLANIIRNTADFLEKSHVPFSHFETQKEI